MPVWFKKGLHEVQVSFLMTFTSEPKL